MMQSQTKQNVTNKYIIRHISDAYHVIVKFR